jgi:hypothetical protein
MEQPDDVLGNEPQQPAVPDKGQGKDDTVTIPRSEWEATRREREELQRSNEDWASHFRRGGAAPAAEPAGETEDGLDPEGFVDAELDEPAVKGDTPEQFVDAIAAQGAKAIADRGFVSKAEAQRIAVQVAERVSRELIGREQRKMSTDTQILGEFPELRDQKSELFIETAKRYQRAVAMDPNAKKTPAALFLAADAARESLNARKAPRSRDGEDDDSGRSGPEREPERRQRAASQDSRPKGRQEIDDFDDMLGREAQQVIRAMGITPDEYKASRRETLGRRR